MSDLIARVMPYQQEALCDVTTRFLGVSGGKRSGKSRIITVLKAIILSSIHPGKHGVVASPVYGMTRRNILPLFRTLVAELKLTARGLETNSPGKLEIDWPGGTSIIWLDVTIENWGRLNGPSLAWICADECDKARIEDMREFMREATFRISDPYHGQAAQINLTGAPELNGFLAEFFIEQASPEKKLFKWSMMENESLSTAYKESILATIPEKLQAGWVRGEFMYNVDSLVYDAFDPVVNHTDLTLADLSADERIHVCWDINDGGTSVVLGPRRGRHLLILDEWMAMKDTEAVIAKVKRQPWASRAVLSTDPACTQVFTYIHQSGLHHQIMRATPEIEHRVTAVNLRLGTKSESAWDGEVRPHLLINTKRCKVLTKCMMRQGYENGKPQKGRRYWIEDAKTDISGPLDALGYLVFREFPFNPRAPVRQVPLRST